MTMPVRMSLIGRCRVGGSTWSRKMTRSLDRGTDRRTENRGRNRMSVVALDLVDQVSWSGLVWTVECAESLP